MCCVDTPCAVTRLTGRAPDWKELRDSIRKRIELIPTCRGDTKAKEVQLAQEEVDEAEEIVR